MQYWAKDMQTNNHSNKTCTAGKLEHLESSYFQSSRKSVNDVFNTLWSR